MQFELDLPTSERLKTALESAFNARGGATCSHYQGEAETLRRRTIRGVLELTIQQGMEIFFLPGGYGDSIAREKRHPYRAIVFIGDDGGSTVRFYPQSDGHPLLVELKPRDR